MFTRSYFLSLKISHNDNTGKYTWFNGVMNTVSFMPLKPDDLIHAAREVGADEMQMECKKNNIETFLEDVEIMALNRI